MMKVKVLLDSLDRFITLLQRKHYKIFYIINVKF